MYIALVGDPNLERGPKITLMQGNTARILLQDSRGQHTDFPFPDCYPISWKPRVRPCRFGCFVIECGGLGAKRRGSARLGGLGEQKWREWGTGWRGHAR